MAPRPPRRRAGPPARPGPPWDRGADGPTAGQCLDLARSTRPPRPGRPHEHDAVGEGVRLLQVVRREQHRAAAGRPGAGGDPEGATGLDVHRRRRLVQDQQLRVGREREGEADALCLAARELVGLPSGDVGDPCPVEHPVRRLRLRVEVAHQLDQLANGEVRQQTAGLQHRADPAPGRRGARRAAEQVRRCRSRAGSGRAAGRWPWTCRHRSAPAGRRPRRRDRQVEPVDRLRAAVGLV